MGLVNEHKGLINIIFSIIIIIMGIIYFKYNYIAPKGNYDLVALEIKHSDNPNNFNKKCKIKVGQRYYIMYSYTNKGNNILPSGTYGMFLTIGNKKKYNGSGGTPCLNNVKYTLTPSKINFYVAPDKTGWVNYKLVLDPYNRVKETDESNNTVEGKFYIYPDPNCFV
jgi:hypothetical protein